jgi:hypothetical protein
MEARIIENASLKGTLTAGSGTQVIKVVEKDYNELDNKPSINGTELIGNILSDDLHIGTPLTNTEIENLINNIQL